RRSRSLAFKFPGPALWLADGVENSRAHNYCSRASHGVVGEGSTCRAVNWWSESHRTVCNLRCSEDSAFLLACPWQHAFYRGRKRYSTEPQTLPQPRSALHASQCCQNSLPCFDLQHCRTLANGMARRSYSEKIRHASHLPAGCVSDPLAICGSNCNRDLYVCH